MILLGDPTLLLAKNEKTEKLDPLRMLLASTVKDEKVTSDGKCSKLTVSECAVLFVIWRY